MMGRPPPARSAGHTAAGPPMMGRPPTGRLDVDTLADGTRVFRLRFHADGRRERRTLHERRDCACGCGGGWSERTARVELENELARIRAGVWQRPARTTADRTVRTAAS